MWIWPRLPSNYQIRTFIGHGTFLLSPVKQKKNGNSSERFSQKDRAVADHVTPELTLGRTKLQTIKKGSNSKDRIIADILNFVIDNKAVFNN
jgi:hypothetical protein